MKKVLLMCTTSSTVKNFRVPLIKALQQKGYQVGVIVFDDGQKEMIQQLGVDYFCIGGANRSLNPFKILTMKRAYAKIVKEYQPDVVLTFMLKPNVLGAPVAIKLGVKKVVSFIDGLGDVFILNTLKFRLIRKVVCLLYKNAFKKIGVAVFSNEDDKQEFLKRKLIIEQKCKIIRGVGVDLEKFSYTELKNTNVFLMVARMLKTKGVLEYCQCARIVKKQYPNVTFNYLGGEGTVKLQDIQEFIDDGSVNYLGEVVNVKPYLDDCGVFVLPSYREGIPVSTMEAESVGRGVITSDCAGCKETVKNGFNGYLIEKGNVQELTLKVIELIKNPELVKKMGANSRKFVEENFDSCKMSLSVLTVIEEGL